jgi:Transmembrane protein of unknown function (DUF3556)
MPISRPAANREGADHVAAALLELGGSFSPLVRKLIAEHRQPANRNFPEDLRPSEHAVRLAHAGGTFVEFVTPLVLLFSHNHTVTVAAVVLMLCFHLFIISTFPLAVPLEWNALFMYLVAFLFLATPSRPATAWGTWTRRCWP